MITRRELLKATGAGVALAATPGCSSEQLTERATLTHIVVVCMENRSFDHLLGARKLGGLVNAGDGLTADMSNPTSGGELIRVHPVEILCGIDPSHSWVGSHMQWNQGAMDGFLRASGDSRQVMAYLTEGEVPWTWALAQGSTVCDRWFCSLLGPTWPNRFYMLSGQSGGLIVNDYPPGGNQWPTVFHQLTDKGVGWTYYYSDLPVVPLWPDLGDQAHVRRVDDFFDHAAAGTLAPVTVIDPGFIINDDHPPHHPMLGQQFLASIYAALADSPQWANVLLVITYDEHGGFFDHVAPPTAPDERAAMGLDQLGMRVPAILAGPWVKTGVSSQVHDHTSIIKQIALMHDLPPLTLRSDAASDLEDGLDHERLAAGAPAPPLDLPVIEVDLQTIDDACFKRGPRYAGWEPPDIARLADTHRGLFGAFDRRQHLPETMRRIAWELERRGKGGIRRR
jgi:phospholipase C